MFSTACLTLAEQGFNPFQRLLDFPQWHVQLDAPMPAPGLLRNDSWR